MKKLIFIGCYLLVMTICGCGGVQNKIAKGSSNSSLDGAPNWVLDPSSIAGVCAVGSAAHSLGGIQFQRNEAMANGRDELARMITVKVKNGFNNFAEQTGVGDSQTFDKVTKDVSQQLAKQTLNGSRQKDMWISQDGTMYLLVILDPKSVALAAKQAARTSFKNEDALSQKLESKEALKKLDEDIDKEFDK
jgi:hypothetical protein